MAPWRLSLICACLTLWSSRPTFGQRAKPGDFPWRFRLVVSNDSEVFHGALKFDIYFDPKTSHHQTLIIGQTTYKPGSVHSSLEKLSEGNTANTLARIEASVVSDVNNCTPQSVSVQEISLTSFHKRQTFLKRFGGDLPVLTLLSPCENSSKNASLSNEIVRVGGFKSVRSNDCYYQGEFYESNQSFDIGCEMKCRCKESMVDCDSMCKPVSAPLPRNCRMASVDRRCCDETECMEDAVWDSCPIHTAARDKMPPWAVLLTIPQGRNQSEEKRTCGASIIHKKLLITSAYCVRSSQRATDPIDSPASILVTPSASNSSIIGRAKSIHIHPSYNGKDASSDLALIELAQEGLEYGESLKRINLPWPTLCKRYVASGCAVQYTTIDDSDSFVGTVVPTSRFCASAASNSIPRPAIQKSQSDNGTEPVFCVQRTTDGLAAKKSVENVQLSKRCGQEDGNGVATKRGQYHYVVGVAAHDYKAKLQSPEAEAVLELEADSRPESIPIRRKRGDQTASAAGQQKPAKDEDGGDGNWRSCGRQYVPVTSLCPHIDWLKSTINELLARK